MPLPKSDRGTILITLIKGLLLLGVILAFSPVLRGFGGAMRETAQHHADQGQR